MGSSAGMPGCEWERSEARKNEGEKGPRGEKKQMFNFGILLNFRSSVLCEGWRGSWDDS